ncbi:putative EG45-like domain containing protein 1 [Chenopodium quinoa]|uniref:putative EG45-like domain containing protein 1 n=1 Tax=Chenopodium quinoa TaxID=63459 RepID=UPI000B78D533|nr:putative EG45-like domain containing protein 1 [Chenopodium quinoa]
MSMSIKISLVIALISITTSLISLSSAIPGTATYYSSYTPSACNGSIPGGTFIAAAGDELWDGGKNCRKILEVACTGSLYPFPHPCKIGKSVYVIIVDRFPNCVGTIDLSKEAFASIADPVFEGVITIEYQPI